MNNPTSPQTLTIRQQLAINLRLRRAMLEWSQETLAEAAGLDCSFVGALERAERNVSIDSLEKLATALEMTLAELLTESGVSEVGGHILERIRGLTLAKSQVREASALYSVTRG